MVGLLYGLAKIFQKHLLKGLGWKNRGVRSKKEKQFYVLRNTNMPAILTENGFYTNKEECKKMLSEEYIKKIAYAHFLAIKETEEIGLFNLPQLPKQKKKYGSTCVFSFQA